MTDVILYHTPRNPALGCLLCYKNDISSFTYEPECKSWMIVGKHGIVSFFLKSIPMLKSLKRGINILLT